MMHELFNFEDPICLYCKSQCETNASGIINQANIMQDTYTCIRCKEYFVSYYYDNRNYITFSFSCNDFHIVYNYSTHNLDIYPDKRKLLKDFHNRIRIPWFNVDFSDKDKLYEKLKIYVVFS